MGIFSPHKDVHRHGLQWPPNQLQIFEVVVVLFSAALFAGVCVPLVDQPWCHIIGGSYGLSVIALATAAAYVAGVDPSSKVDESLESQGCNKGPWCYSCSLHRKFRTEHCSFCNRCVDNFDHHCIWLNNCVGGANYKAFVITLTMVWVMTSIIVGTCLFLVVGIANGSIDDDNGRRPIALSIPSIVVLVILNFPLLILDINLAIFHMGLNKKSMTTMEYLRACNAWEKERALQYEMGCDLEVSKAPADKNAFKPFPMWCDWVILRRRGKPPPKTKTAAKVHPAEKSGQSSGSDGELRETANGEQCSGDVPSQQSALSLAAPAPAPEQVKEPASLEQASPAPSSSSAAPATANLRETAEAQQESLGEPPAPVAEIPQQSPQDAGALSVSADGHDLLDALPACGAPLVPKTEEVSSGTTATTEQETTLAATASASSSEAPAPPL